MQNHGQPPRWDFWVRHFVSADDQAGIADGLWRRRWVISKREHDRLSILDLDCNRKRRRRAGIANCGAVLIDTAKARMRSAGKINGDPLIPVLDETMSVVILRGELADHGAIAIPFAHKAEGRLWIRPSLCRMKGHCAVAHHVAPTIDPAWLRAAGPAKVKKGESTGSGRLSQRQRGCRGQHGQDYQSPQAQVIMPRPSATETRSVTHAPR